MDAMSNLLPALLTIICIDGHRCEEETYLMPSWEKCFEATTSASQTQSPRTVDRQEFHITLVCVGQERKK